MQASLASFARLSDADLLTTVQHLAATERQATARLIASLGELDARRLHLAQGCSSLFTYCTQVLRLSEHAAYGRIEAARAARRFPVILEDLAAGDVTLTTVTLLAAHLTFENHRGILDQARHRSKRDVEVLVARLRPQPAVPSSVRKVPSSTPTRAAAATPATANPASIFDQPIAAASPAPGRTSEPPPRAVVAPLAPERYKIQVTVSGETVATLRRAQDLLRHAVPNGDPAIVIDRALTLLVEHLERRKLGATTAPRRSRAPEPGSRHIPAAVRRAVWARDEGRCAYVGPTGRCAERGFLEFHHEVPYAAGGEATIDTIALRCRAHNQHEARLDFGIRASEYRAATKDRHVRARERPSEYNDELGPDRVGQRCGGLDGTPSTAAVA